jgi:hypothetical protein
MKTQCAFCKTEYNIPDNSRGRVRCACCGHTWRPKKNNKKIWIFAAIAAAIILLFSILYSLFSIAPLAQSGPLEMEITAQAIDSDGYWRASGTITNNADSAYGIPNMRVKIGDDMTTVLSPIPVLGAGEVGEFEISGQTTGTGEIEITFTE